MSRGLKIGLAIGAGVLVLCCVGAVLIYFVARDTLLRSVSIDPDKAAEIGREIADYTPPRGYKEQAGMTFLGMKLVILAPDLEMQDQTILMLMQFPANMRMSQEEMERQMRDSWAQQGGQQYQDFRVVGTEEVTIRGRPVTLTVSEGRSNDGEITRQVVCAFPGKDERMALFMAMGPEAAWNQSAVSEFLASIR